MQDLKSPEFSSIQPTELTKELMQLENIYWRVVVLVQDLGTKLCKDIETFICSGNSHEIRKRKGFKNGGLMS